jgi:predicted ATPase/DNA-binding SARP family transcriptional activator
MSAPLTLHLLGGAAIAHGDDPLADFRSRTAEALLLYLACHDRPISRQFLADFFWDDRTQKQASANLRAVLSMLRKQVGDYLTADRQTIAFNHKEPNWVDALVFETQIRVLEPRLNQPGGLTAENCHQLEAAMALYQGDFLAGFHLSESRGFEEWVVVQRERLRRLAVLGLRRLVEYFLENGRYQTGIAYAERLIAADPYNEEAQRRQMWLLIRSGRRNSALDSYQRFKALLEEDLAVDPSQATTAVYDKIAALTFPPPDNIAVPPAPLIGRKAEVNELFGELIRPDGRLITITGPGGVGKTSLALEIANQFKRVRPGYFLDGLWFVPLAPVHSGRFLESAAANALALTFRGTAAPRSQLLNHLQNREMLLIFDNFEHLLVGEDSAVTLISDILEQAPGVKILATSREQLNLREELIFDIEGLPYPTGPTPPEAAADFGAVAVFLQNARRVSRRFEPEAADFQTISRICRLLEGMPLGLEMAAAWVRHDNVGQILARLEESLQALASTWRNIPERHRSLQSVFDHSWQLLTAQEQAEFVRLAVFQGGFSPGAALAVAGMSKPSVYHGKSLLRREEYGRFAMHNLIHQFTADKLRRDEAAHAAALRSHAHHYLHLLQEQENAFYGDPAQSALNKITTDLENIRQAWQWAVDQGELALLDKAYLSLYLYYETRGWFEEGQTHFQEAVTRLGERLGEIEQADREGQLVFGRLQSRAGWFAYRCGQIDQAFKRCQDSAAGFRRLNAEADLAQSLNDLGILARRSGDYEKGKEMLTESLAIRRQIGDERGVAACLNNLANVVRMLGEYDQAREHLLQSIA